MLLFFAAAQTLFALSDVQGFVGALFFHQTYSYEQNDYLQSGKTVFSAGIMNHIFLWDENRIGFFESLSYEKRDDAALTLLTGPSFNLALTDTFSLIVSPAVNASCAFKGDSTEFSEERGTALLFCFGGGTDLQIKALAHTHFSPVVGISAAFNPLYYCTVKIDDWYYATLENFAHLYVRPYAAFSYNW